MLLVCVCVSPILLPQKQTNETQIKQQPRLVGSLLTAILEFSNLSAGMQVSYVEMTNVGVTLVGSEATTVYVALFHDREDGATFGRLIASEVYTVVWYGHVLLAM